MKKVINASVGGRNFCIEEDAYERLSQYLENFREALAKDNSTSDEAQDKEIMSEIESRIAELLLSRMANPACAVSLDCINSIACQLGMPDGSCEPVSEQTENCSSAVQVPLSVKRRLFRDPDSQILGGVCSGLGYYSGCDKTVIRIIFCLVAITLGFSFKLGFGTFSLSFGIGAISPIIYLILWLVIPRANTPADKCIMRGIPATAENMRKFK